MKIKTTFLWRSPARYFFPEGIVPEGLDRDEARDEIYFQVKDLLKKDSPLLALEEYFDAKGSLTFEINGDIIKGENRDLADEGEGRFEVHIEATGEIPEDMAFARENILEKITFLPESFLVSVKEV